MANTAQPAARTALRRRRITLIILLIVLFAAAVCALSTLSALKFSRENRRLAQQNTTLLAQANSLSQQVGRLEGELDDLNALYAAMKQSPEYPSYQSLYPDLYVEGVPADQERENTVFLTFDDGPSARTDEVLSILEREGIKATFFVVGPDTAVRRERLQRIAEAGHTIGVHSASHDYKKIYASVEAYLDDFYQVYQMVKEATGTAPTIFRFPGGSINSYNRGIHQEIMAEMLRRGFLYYDWNSSSQDATKDPLPPKTIVSNVLSTLDGQSRAVVLMHDSAARSTTVEALPGMIRALRNRGYAFAPLTRDDLPIVFDFPRKS